MTWHDITNGWGAYKNEGIAADRRHYWVDLEEIVTLLKNHFAPTPSETVQRFHFNRRNQKLDESIAAYIAELRRLSENCNFGNSLDSLLRDRLVCGVRDETLQRWLLAKSNLTFALAQEEALAYEAASVHSKEIQESSIKLCTSESHQLQNKTPKAKSYFLHSDILDPTQGNCNSCGGNHRRDVCRFREAVCHKCKRHWHLQIVCHQVAYPVKVKPASASSSHKVEQRGAAAESFEDGRDTSVYSAEIINSVGDCTTRHKTYTRHIRRSAMQDGSGLRIQLATRISYGNWMSMKNKVNCIC
ncbi:uncharacterized protein LOC120524433 [Polypterus senegalus]|uniref:uncharacterized protein LOC120524433 n=1 Tax=Polypterus senegalus TaxID=55291 RepID=UPI0019642B21|nr:uncharacterized protein LOC120524433 [Polypterus senegalus]